MPASARAHGMRENVRRRDERHLDNQHCIATFSTMLSRHGRSSSACGYLLLASCWLGSTEAVDRGNTAATTSATLPQSKGAPAIGANSLRGGKESDGERARSLACGCNFETSTEAEYCEPWTVIADCIWFASATW